MPQETPSTPAKFARGTRVKVRQGITASARAEIAFGGWIGTVREVRLEFPEASYRLEWDMATLEQMPIAYRELCERQGKDRGTGWFSEKDLEPAPGELAVVSPAISIAQPLRDDTPADVVWTLPRSSFTWTTGPTREIQWTKGSVARGIVYCALLGACAGIPLGSILAAMEIVQIGAIAGAIPLGLIGFWIGRRLGFLFERANRLKQGARIGSLVGAVTGALFGALIGSVMGAIVGIAIGAVLGIALGSWFRTVAARLLSVLFGALAGATAQAFYFDSDKALEGAVFGGAIGALAGVGSFTSLACWVVWLRRNRPQSTTPHRSSRTD